MGKAAYGTVIQVQNAAGSTSYTSIGEVRDIAGGGFQVDTADVTHHKSAMEEIVPTVIRTQELTFTVNYNPRSTTHGGDGAFALRALLLSRAKRTYKLITPAATSTAADVLHFNAFVTGMNLNYPVTDGETAEFTVKPVGPTASTYSTLSVIP